MANFTILRGEEAQFGNAVIQDGAVYYCEDTKNLYVGNSDGTKDIFASGVGKTYISGGTIGGEIACDYINNTATDIYSFVTGEGTRSTAIGSLVGGRYNNGGENVLFSIGNGSSSARSDAFTIDSSGNAVVQNRLTATNITATETMTIPVKASSYSSSTPGEIWIVTA